MLTKRKRLEMYHTLNHFISEHGNPWADGDLESGFVDVLKWRRGNSRLAIPYSAENYVEEVTAMFEFVIHTRYNDIRTTYELRDKVLGSSENRVTTRNIESNTTSSGEQSTTRDGENTSKRDGASDQKRTSYAAPDGVPYEAFSTGMETTEGTTGESSTDNSSETTTGSNSSSGRNTANETTTETAPMHENVDRALSVQEGWKDFYTEAIKAFDTCFLGVMV